MNGAGKESLQTPVQVSHLRQQSKEHADLSREHLKGALRGAHGGLVQSRARGVAPPWVEMARPHSPTMLSHDHLEVPQLEAAR